MFNIDKETFRDILDKARHFQVQEAETTPEVDDYLESTYGSKYPIYEEVVQIINNLSADQQATLVALMYIGRGDFKKNEWSEAYKLAEQEITAQTGEYLLSKPSMAEDIAKGLNIYGISL